MTPEQQQLTSENHNLIYGYIHKHGLDYEEWYGEMAWALCRAAQTYDPSRGVSFATFAWECFRRRVSHCLFEASRPKRSLRQTVSLTRTYNKSEGEYDLDVEDDTDYFGAFESLVAAESFIARMTPYLQDRDVELMRYVVAGYGFPDIARMFGVSRQAIDIRVKKIRRYAIAHNLDLRTA